MKALTICQPYADMIARGEKWIENRTWPTAYRGHLAIHAGKSKDWLDEHDMAQRPSMAFGAVVALARLSGCCRVEDLLESVKDDPHAEGPWCWILSDIVPFPTPIPARGAQGLWEWTR